MISNPKPCTLEPRLLSCLYGQLIGSAPRPAQCGDASGTGVFDTAARAWDSERMRCIDPGLEDFFPQLTGPDQVRRLILKHLKQSQMSFSQGRQTVAIAPSCSVFLLSASS